MCLIIVRRKFQFVDGVEREWVKVDEYVEKTMKIPKKIMFVQ